MADALGLAFGPVVRQERGRLGLRQIDLARRIGFANKSAVALIERSNRTDPHLSTLRKVAGGLGMRPSELLALVEAYAVGHRAAQGGDAEDRRAPPVDADQPAQPDGPDPHWPAGVPFTFTHPTAGTETGDLLRPGINRVEGLTA